MSIPSYASQWPTIPRPTSMNSLTLPNGITRTFVRKFTTTVSPSTKDTDKLYEEAASDLMSVKDLIRFAITRFADAGIAYGKLSHWRLY
jgi:hypothetical protein